MQFGIGADDVMALAGQVSAELTNHGGSGIESSGHRVEGKVRFRGASDLCHNPILEELRTIEKDFSLVSKVAEESPFGQPGTYRDLRCRSPVESPLREERQGGFLQTSAAVRLPSPHGIIVVLTVADIRSSVMSVTDVTQGCHGEVITMRIFVTGASGWIGSAVVPELLGAGHEVIGLARSDVAARSLLAAGADVQRGDLDDTAGLAEAAANSEGVIHLAFQHEVAFAGDFVAAAVADRRAVEVMGAALAGSDRPLVLASGMLGLSRGRAGTENDGLVPSAEVRANPAGRRAATALFSLSLAGTGVRSSVLRFPPTVHGDGDEGFIARLVGIARDHGVASYVAKGTNRWPAVHRSDAARLARLVIESAPAGSVLHAVGDEGVPFRKIAESIGNRLCLPVTSIPPAEADEHFGFLGPMVTMDSPATAQVTRELLGWEPTGPTLLEDLAQGHYYRPK